MYVVKLAPGNPQAILPMGLVLDKLSLTVRIAALYQLARPLPSMRNAKLT
jgi:hypothetical protein